MSQAAYNVPEGGTDAAEVTGTGASYPPPSGTSWSTAVGVAKSPGYAIRVGLIRWDTSSLGDAATITAAILRIYITQIDDADGRSLTAEWYDAGSPGLEDYTSTVGADAHAGTALSSLVDDAVNELTLINVSNISKTGYTGLRLHISGAAPSGTNNININTSYGTGPVPNLVVDYEGIPDEPIPAQMAVGQANWESGWGT